MHIETQRKGFFISFKYILSIFAVLALNVYDICQALNAHICFNHHIAQRPGGRLNIDIQTYQYKDSYYKAGKA